MSLYKIDKGIPPPPPKRAKYPWRAMKVGDSFAVPCDSNGSPQPSSGKIATGFEFVVRKIKEGNPPREVWRVWRIK